MKTIWTEDEVQIATLSDQLEGSGFDVARFTGQHIMLHSNLGLPFYIVRRTKKFLRLLMIFELRRDRSRSDKLELVRRLNNELFWACFALDENENLLAWYSSCYAQGLHIAQFMRLTERFISLIDHIVESKNEDGMIEQRNLNMLHFDPRDDMTADASEHIELDSSIPANVLLN